MSQDNIDKRDQMDFNKFNFFIVLCENSRRKYIQIIHHEPEKDFFIYIIPYCRIKVYEYIFFIQI